MNTSSKKVEVFVRIKPTAQFAQDLIECPPDGKTVNIFLKKDPKKFPDSKDHRLNSMSFPVDGVFQNASQEDVYTKACKRLVVDTLDGFNGMIMCCGQTGSGRTYTMTGSTSAYKQRGLIPRVLQEIFKETKQRTDQTYTVTVSYLEIYNETLTDLLVPPKGQQPQLSVLEEPARGVFVKGLSLHPAHSEEEGLNLLFLAESNRLTGSGGSNKSPKSHFIFTVYIQSQSLTYSEAGNISSRINMVVLAGSEKQKKNENEGLASKEAMQTNKSLSFLEQVAVALADQRRDHIPFRQSKLTHILKDSLGGNSNIVLVANIVGEASQIEETVSTLRFGSRIRSLPINPASTRTLDSATQIEKLQKEVEMLKQELVIFNTMINRPDVSYDPLTEAQVAEIQDQVERYLEGQLQEINVVSKQQLQEIFFQFKLAVHKHEETLKSELMQEPEPVMEEQKTSEGSGLAPPSSLEVETAEATVPPTPVEPPPTVTPTIPRPKTKVSRKAAKYGDGTPVTKMSDIHQKAKAAPEKEPEPVVPAPPPAPQPSAEEGIEDEHLRKAKAFEDFKAGKGSEINISLKENKAILQERSNLLRQVTKEVNAIKADVDRAAGNLQKRRNAMNQDGQATEKQMTDMSSELLLQLEELQKQYQQRLEIQRDLKADVNYCQQVVDQCRVRLLEQFEKWYKQSMMGEAAEETPDASSQVEDKAVPVQSREEVDNAPASSFYIARQKSLSRKRSGQRSTKSRLNLGFPSNPDQSTVQRRFPSGPTTQVWPAMLKVE